MIHHIESGQGFPLILIHGYCEHAAVWKNLSIPLSQYYRILCPDLPGFGNSEQNEELSIESVSDEIAKWLEKLSIDSCIIIGHSLGGYITLAIAERHPDKVKAYGLYHSTSLADSEEKKKTRSGVKPFIETHGSKKFIDSLVPNLFGSGISQSDESFLTFRKIANESSPEAIISYALAMRDRPDRSNILQDPSLPALFVAGKQDKVISLDSSITQTSQQEHIAFHILEHSGHMGMYEEPEKSVEIIKDFVEAHR